MRGPSRRRLSPIAVCVVFAAGTDLFQVRPAFGQLRTQVAVSGLSAPVAFVQDPSDATVQYVVEQGGRIRVVQNGALQATDFLNLSSLILAGGERGLLGLAFSPNYASDRRLFVNYTGSPDGSTVVARFLRSAGNPLVADPSSILELRWSTGLRYIFRNASNHNGGCLAFGPDGYLYIAVGDSGGGGDPAHAAQDPLELRGKILRIDVNVPDPNADGFVIPSDNPFAGADPLGARDEIWAFGVRNPWRFSFDDPALGGTGAMIVGDVGQNAREEVNYEPAGAGGRNYGWRIREGSQPYDNSLPPAYTPLTGPLLDYPHSIGRSVTGGYVYRGTSLPAFWRGRYFYADFVSGRIWSVGLNLGAGGEATVANQIEHTAELTGLGNISSFGVDAGGELYIVSYSSGSVLRLAPPCTYSITPASHSFGFPGGTSIISISTQSDCGWSVAGGASWLSTSSPPTTGSANLTLSAASNAFGSFRTATLVVAGQGVTVTQARMPLPRDARGDLDGDGRADLTVFRPSNGRWYTLRSSDQFMTATERTWGATADIPVARDYDGDGRLDFAVHRPWNGTWYILESTTLFGTAIGRAWGADQDVPVPADYDGDGRADLAVFRRSNGTWYVLESSTGFGTSTARNWGVVSDQPTPGDYDGDGRADFAVFRPSNGTWYVLQSSSGHAAAFALAWGVSGDIPVPADYDGDGRTDIAVYRPSNGTWYVLESWSGWATAIGKRWGGYGSDVPVPADHDGDGRADFAVFRPGTGTWFVSNQFAVRWGTLGDIAVRPQ